MKIKAQVRDGYLRVTVFKSPGLKWQQAELESFRNLRILGFLRPERVKGNLLFLGPRGITLRQYLEKPISRYDFFQLVEQIFDASIRLISNDFRLSQVRWSLDEMYINELTKELALLYVPVWHEAAWQEGEEEPLSQHPEAFRLLYELMYSVKAPETENLQYLGDLDRFLREQACFNPWALEGYVEHLEPAIVRNRRGRCFGQIDSAREKTLSHDDLSPEELAVTGLLYTPDDEDTSSLALRREGAFQWQLKRLKDGTLRSVGERPMILGREQVPGGWGISGDRSISRKHVLVRLEQGKVFVRDLSSTNGSSLEESPMEPQLDYEMTAGQKLTIGSESFLLVETEVEERGNPEEKGR